MNLLPPAASIGSRRWLVALFFAGGAAAGAIFALGSERADARGTHGNHCKGRWPAIECPHLRGPRNDVDGAPPWFYNVEPTP